MLHRLHDCLTIIAKLEPELFSTRGHINLNTLASPEACSSTPKASDMVFRLAYPVVPVVDEYEGEVFEWPTREDELQHLIIRRFSRENTAGWIKEYDRALAHYSIDDEDLKDLWAKSA